MVNKKRERWMEEKERVRKREIGERERNTCPFSVFCLLFVLYKGGLGVKDRYGE